ncbi:helicase associated domain-containing protein [Streptomyces longisporoflavus]|uniref:Helicase associated domain-containing protein n=1 Tax=Streptomyces longisporoflavus TaxID=28044 RepID=A0ABW7R601_9ACTN
MPTSGAVHPRSALSIDLLSAACASCRVRHARSGRGLGHQRRSALKFAEGLAAARAYADVHGHLAVERPRAPESGDGFDLGTWLRVRRTRAQMLSPEQARSLAELDAWWNPPWPMSWQRA